MKRKNCGTSLTLPLEASFITLKTIKKHAIADKSFEFSDDIVMACKSLINGQIPSCIRWKKMNTRIYGLMFSSESQHIAESGVAGVATSG